MTPGEREALRDEFVVTVTGFDGSDEDVTTWVASALDRYADAVAAPLVEALRVELQDARERARGSTHWPGCSANHRECATYERVEAALAAYEAGK